MEPAPAPAHGAGTDLRRVGFERFHLGLQCGYERRAARQLLAERLQPVICMQETILNRGREYETARISSLATHVHPKSWLQHPRGFGWIRDSPAVLYKLGGLGARRRHRRRRRRNQNANEPKHVHAPTTRAHTRTHERARGCEEQGG